ncbi:MAG TPA: NAD(P)H-binding protein [Verrucomicrobiae bacterium]|nr:NAD(P)H-binding protein [Verrucomicrobiae bacterium]
MKLFILGATGGIGRHLIQIALERGHQVTAYVRAPQKIASAPERLRVVPGDVFNADQMMRAMSEHDMVLSAFGPLTIRTSTLRRQFGQTLVMAMRRSGVRRTQVVSAAFLFRNVGISGRILKATLFRQMIPDMAGMEAAVCQSDLDWTIVRPPRLTNGPARHAYRVADDMLPDEGFLISRADVAHFMISEAEHPAHLKQIVGLAN